VQLKDANALKACLGRLDENDRDKLLDAETLSDLGLPGEAKARALRDISQHLKDLCDTNDPNIHFPMMAIDSSLEFLVNQGAKEEARHWLHRALKEMPTWPVVRRGWLTSSVHHSLARAVARIEGSAAAEGLVRKALSEARAEPRRDFRQGALGAALDLKANTGKLAEAIEDARKLRSPTRRRKTLATLLARAQRWTELRQVLSEVKMPEEAADIAWWIKFELPRGQAR
jgi:hypothetical protein